MDAPRPRRVPASYACGAARHRLSTVPADRLPTATEAAAAAARGEGLKRCRRASALQPSPSPPVQCASSVSVRVWPPAPLCCVTTREKSARRWGVFSISNLASAALCCAVLCCAACAYRAGAAAWTHGSSQAAGGEGSGGREAAGSKRAHLLSHVDAPSAFSLPPALGSLSMRHSLAPPSSPNPGCQRGSVRGRVRERKRGWAGELDGRATALRGEGSKKICCANY